jgi:pimeloyl-ACP methyl ester carboxylesterase
VSEPPELPGVEHRWVSAGGLRTHVALAGNGTPLLLLHGWPQHWWCWRYLIPLLASSHRVIAPDLRGHGWTDAPPGGYDKETLASDVLALLDALELERVQLIGHDWGGWVGFLLCLRAPERFERYLALNTGHPWPSADARNLLSLWRFAYQLVVGSPAAGPWLLRTQADRLMERALRDGAARPEAFTDADLAIFAERLRDPARAHASSLLYRTFVLSEQLPIALGRYRSQRLRTSTRMLFGTQDPVLTPRLLEGYEPHADDMSVELVEDAGHFIAEDRPELVAERALAFFAGGSRS